MRWDKARWHNGSELPDGEIRCLCKFKIGDYCYYRILESRPDSRNYQWIGGKYDEFYTKKEVVSWCPIDEIDAALTANGESFSQ